MTTLIWDNNQDYSNQAIWFIELAPDEDLEGAIKILETYKQYGEPASVTAIVKEIEWREPGSVSTMRVWLQAYAMDLVDLNENSSEDKALALRALPLVWRKRLAEALIQEVSTQQGWHGDWLVKAKAIADDLCRESFMTVRKISDDPLFAIPMCPSPQHPAPARTRYGYEFDDWSLGTYEHTCPDCGNVTIFCISEVEGSGGRKFYHEYPFNISAGARYRFGATNEEIEKSEADALALLREWKRERNDRR